MGHCFSLEKVVSNKSKKKKYFFFLFLIGKKVAIFDWEWGRNSTPREGQKIPCMFILGVMIARMIKSVIGMNNVY